LDHGLHCGSALQAAIKQAAGVAHNEIIFITSAQAMHSAAFHAALAVVRASLSFILTVNRNGDLQFFAFHNGISKLLVTAKFDLNELLFAPPLKQTEKSKPGGIPLFFQQTTPPLLMPVIRIEPTDKRCFYIESLGILLAVNSAQRLLCITDKDKGAKEVLSFIENGNYHFYHKDRNVYLLVVNQQKNLFKLYTTDIYSYHTEAVELPVDLLYTRGIVFHEYHIYFHYWNETGRYSIINNKLEKLSASAIPREISFLFNRQYKPLTTEIRLRHLTPSYTILFNITAIAVNHAGYLTFGKHFLALVHVGHIKLSEDKVSPLNNRQSRPAASEQRYLNNKYVKCNTFTWEDGSYAVVDARGLLHLVSSDAALPQVTIVLIIGRVTAAWSSDGYFCGWSYFLENENGVREMEVSIFYAKYIQAFIDRLI
jgi:MoxR-vWA-beta-propeller ternary system domain bpX1